jgi:3-deoxy-D-manno-octulosonate 8-phosphate phosphatase (KDO 8-P phosphatase)
MVEALPYRHYDLDPAELSRRACATKLVLTDFDGVLTDGRVRYSTQGERERKFSLRDGEAIQRLKRSGISTAIIAQEASSAVEEHAHRLKCHLFVGEAERPQYFDRLRLDLGLEHRELAYVGRALSDTDLAKAIEHEGLTGGPAHESAPILRLVHYRCTKRGGEGMFDEFATWLLALRT